MVYLDIPGTPLIGESTSKSTSISRAKFVDWWNMICLFTQNYGYLLCIRFHIFPAPPKKMHLSPEKESFQKENRLSNHHFSRDMLFFWWWFFIRELMTLYDQSVPPAFTPPEFNILLMVQKSCTNWLVVYPIICRVQKNPRWFAGFLPPTVWELFELPRAPSFHGGILDPWKFRFVAPGKCIALKRKVIYKWHHHFWVSIRSFSGECSVSTHLEDWNRPTFLQVLQLLRHVADKMGGLKSSHLWRIAMGFDGYLAWILFGEVSEVGSFHPGWFVNVCGYTGVTGVGEESWIIESFCSFPGWTQHVIWVVLEVVWLMEEIPNNHLGCIKTCQ